MKNISKEWFKKQSACRAGYEWVLKRADITVIGTINELIKIERIDWANWTICRLLNKKQKIQYVVFAAEQVIDIYEKNHPMDNRPRLAIEAAKKVLEKNNKVNRANAAYAADAAVYAAADAADAAANAADAAANAAAYAADAAANAAAYAADAAAYAAANAADAAAYAVYAAYAAAKKEMQIKILDYGLQLLKIKRSE